MERDAGSDIEQEPRGAIIMGYFLEACLDEARIFVNIGWAEVDKYIQKEEDVNDDLRFEESRGVHVDKGSPDWKEGGCVY